MGQLLEEGLVSTIPIVPNVFIVRCRYSRCHSVRFLRISSLRFSSARSTSYKAYTPPIVRQSEIGSSFTITSFHWGIFSRCIIIFQNPRRAQRAAPVVESAGHHINSFSNSITEEHTCRLNRGLVLHSYTPSSLLSLISIIASPCVSLLVNHAKHRYKMKHAGCHAVCFIVTSRYNSLGSDLSYSAFHRFSLAANYYYTISQGVPACPTQLS